MQKFTQREYSDLVDSLDVALGVFLKLGKTEVEAQAALKDFVSDHYCKVWRPMETAST